MSKQTNLQSRFIIKFLNLLSAANKSCRVAAGQSASTVTSQPSIEVNYEESAIPDEYRPKIKTAASGTTSKATPSACFFNYGKDFIL